MIVRCQCTGQCGKAGRRVCAEPDLTGQCRAESGSVHPRTDRANELTEVQVEPGLWVYLCRDCADAWSRHLAELKHLQEDMSTIPLFPEGTS